MLTTPGWTRKKSFIGMDQKRVPATILLYVAAKTVSHIKKLNLITDPSPAIGARQNQKSPAGFKKSDNKMKPWRLSRRPDCNYQQKTLFAFSLLD